MMAAGVLGVLVGGGLGLMSLVAPARGQRFVGLSPSAPEGTGETRATYGGFFLGLELAAGWAWWSGSATPMTVVGIAWLGAAFGRVVSLLVDGHRTRKNLAGVGFEAVVGLLHLAA
jgi:hypothetical protein